MRKLLGLALALAIVGESAHIGYTVWLGLSAPPAQHLPLPADLIDANSSAGRALLAASPARTDLAQLDPVFVAQSRRAFCGVASSTMLINAALAPQPRLTQDSLFDAATTRAVSTEFALSFTGLTLDQLATLLRVHGLRVRVIHAADSSPEIFRQNARTVLAEPRTFLVVNYDRPLLGQRGGGHISPLGAYSPAADRVLVLDVAAQKYPYTWVPVSRLWQAMNSVDQTSGLSRGYLLVRAP